MSLTIMQNYDAACLFSYKIRVYTDQRYAYGP